MPDFIKRESVTYRYSTDELIEVHCAMRVVRLL